MAKNVNVMDSWVDHAGNTVTRRPNGSLNVSISFLDDPGLTEQHHLAECDLSTIIGRYVRAGQPVIIPPERFVDLTNLPDYQEALNAVHEVNSLFDSLPINVKQAFDQNPKLLMQALHDPSQRQRLIDLGVCEAPVEPVTPVGDKGVNTPASGGDSGST